MFEIKELQTLQKDDELLQVTLTLYELYDRKEDLIELYDRKNQTIGHTRGNSSQDVSQGCRIRKRNIYYLIIFLFL